ncbi:MAG: hypothetical protein OQK24_02925 [Magnetovibrio sp.]|nr:hypothetical protein [Magnetovibrio sp.]
MDNNLDSLIALLIASFAIGVMIVMLYRNGAMPLKGLVVVSTFLVVITTVLATTL